MHNVSQVNPETKAILDDLREYLKKSPLIKVSIFESVSVKCRNRGGIFYFKIDDCWIIALAYSNVFGYGFGKETAIASIADPNYKKKVLKWLTKMT